MILVDPRAGSIDYVPLLRGLGAPVEVVQMDFGDVAFQGSTGVVGIELKKFDDMLTCITTGRFAGHQLPGMASQYDEVYLIVEGLWRPNPTDGTLEQWRGEWRAAGQGKRRWQYRDFTAYLETMEVKGGVRLRRTANPDETARTIYGLYAWWLDYEGHRSHLALNRAGRDMAVFTRPTFVRRVAAELPGVGYEKSGMIAGAFPTVRKLIQASDKDLRKLPGIGKTLAKGIVEAWDSSD